MAESASAVVVVVTVAAVRPHALCSWVAARAAAQCAAAVVVAMEWWRWLWLWSVRQWSERWRCTWAERAAACGVYS